MDIEVGDRVRVVDDPETPGVPERFHGTEITVEEVRKAGIVSEEGYWWIRFQDVAEKVTQSNMTPFYVEVDGPQHSKLLQEIAFEEGFGWRGDKLNTFGIEYENERYLVFRPGGDLYDSDSITICPSKATLDTLEYLEHPSLDEFCRALRGEYQFEDPIMIGENEVEFNDDGITFGCTDVDNDTIKAIYERQFQNS